jgi:serine phosphatase RsbU (regulator of sigma subunit)
MNKSQILELLLKVEIFAAIPKNILEQLSEKIDSLSYSAGSPIIKKGETGNSMFIIAKGKVKVHDEEHTVAFLEAINFFGEFSLLDAAPRSMSITAVDEVEAVAISREFFYTIFKSSPEVAQKIISTLTGRLRNQNEAIINQFRTREEELTRLVNERTLELKLRNEEITIKNKEITDNVNYAKRIQQAILTDPEVIKESFAESFVLYLPKDIVSGDFYSFQTIGKKDILIAADCTGHGVSGAFLSVVGNALLTQIINEKQIQVPGKILDSLHEALITTLNQRNNDSTDGMDVAICMVDKESQKMYYAGANRPLYLIRNNELIIYNADKFPVGGLQILHEKNFQTQEINLMPGDCIYVFTDGYADQFGGDSGKKIMTRIFKEILLKIHSNSAGEQREYLRNYFNQWKGDYEQVDDVLVIGIKN